MGYLPWPRARSGGEAASLPCCVLLLPRCAPRGRVSLKGVLGGAWRRCAVQGWVFRTAGRCSGRARQSARACLTA
eukprot:3289269-Alexandrium_andersonii.AAC.1